MDSTERSSCFLRCLLDSHAPIKLIHNVETIVGRSKITKIKDQSCSRGQLSLKADCDTYSVEVKQLGLNPSGLNGFSLTRNGVYKVEHGSRIDILLNNYTHVIEFDPPPGGYAIKGPEEDDAEPPNKKINLNNDDSVIIQIIQPNESDYWESIDNGELYVFTSKGVKSSTKIAAFDMDGTLITPKSGKVFPVDINDWQLALPTIEKKLKLLNNDGYKLVIMSNQSPIGAGRVKIEDFKRKIEAIVKKVNVPFQVYLATGKGKYRKPCNGMWTTLSKQNNDGVEIDKESSFYCGDAAGRLVRWAPGKKKDHSLADILMAENLEIKFYTPEQFFLGHSVDNIPMAKPRFNPKEVKSSEFNTNLISEGKEILVFVGYPGSGKSFLAKQIVLKSLDKYAIVSRDELGAWQKCVSEAKQILQRGKSVIVDSTNPDRESRARWVCLALDMKLDCRCIRMKTTMAHAQHNNTFREIMKTKHVPVPDVVYHTYRRKYEEPSFKEGFKEIVHLDFCTSFDNPEHEKLYRLHLLEK